jgi:hypothetical protein
MLIRTIAKKKTFVNLWCQLRCSGPLIENETFASKHSKVGHLRLFTGDKLIGSLLVKLVKIEAVDGMSSRVDSFDPKDVLSLVLIQHSSFHLNKGSILPLNHPVLLRGTRS